MTVEKPMIVLRHEIEKGVTRLPRSGFSGWVQSGLFAFDPELLVVVPVIAEADCPGCVSFPATYFRASGPQQHYLD